MKLILENFSYWVLENNVPNCKPVSFDVKFCDTGLAAMDDVQPLKRGGKKKIRKNLKKCI